MLLPKVLFGGRKAAIKPFAIAESALAVSIITKSAFKSHYAITKSAF